MSGITTFNFKDHEVRVITGDDGEPWWVASDVAKVLGVGQTPDMVRNLDVDEKGMYNIHTLGGPQSVTTITEAGLYSCILRSRKPQAKEFKRWVTHEVLPSIRKHGGYLTPEATEQALTDPDFIIRLATELKNQRARTTELEAHNAALAPKARFADAVAASTTSILVGDLAKILRGNGIQLGATRLFTWLRNHGYLINRKGSDWNSPTQKSMELELFEVKETVIKQADGHLTVHKTPKVTGKGQNYFVTRFLDGTFTPERG